MTDFKWKNRFFADFFRKITQKIPVLDFEDVKNNFQNKKMTKINETQKNISLFKNSTFGIKYFQKPLDKAKKMCYDNTNQAG